MMDSCVNFSVQQQNKHKFHTDLQQMNSYTQIYSKKLWIIGSDRFVLTPAQIWYFTAFLRTFSLKDFGFPQQSCGLNA